MLGRVRQPDEPVELLSGKNLIHSTLLGRPGVLCSAFRGGRQSTFVEDENCP